MPHAIVNILRKEEMKLTLSFVTLLVSFDLRFIGRDEETRRNDEACRAIPRPRVEPDETRKNGEACQTITRSRVVSMKRVAMARLAEPFRVLGSCPMKRVGMARLAMAFRVLGSCPINMNINRNKHGFLFIM